MGEWKRIILKNMRYDEYTTEERKKEERKE